MDDINKMIGIGYFNFDSQGPYSSELKTICNNYPATANMQIPRRGGTIMRRMYLSTSDTSTKRVGLTYIQNGRKLCHARSCTEVKHPNSIVGSLIPFHPYLTLPGSHIIHPFPLFRYKGFTEETIAKLNQLSINHDEDAKIRIV